uniref:Uncharacterized protein n=1 Tax=Faecalibaculum rodentium TaxID=1702221 RepID=A0A140DYS4_9FIRM|nr:hypothetical protein AALO17_26670 [Faecalibaculum rodentium]
MRKGEKRAGLESPARIRETGYVLQSVLPKQKALPAGTVRK